MAQKNPDNGGMDPTEILMALGVIVLISLIFWSAAHKQIAQVYSALRVVQFFPFWVVQQAKVMLGWWAYAVVPACVLGVGMLWGWWRASTGKTFWFPVAMGGVATGALLGLSSVFAGWFEFFWASDKGLVQFGHLAKSSFVANLMTVFVVVVPFSFWVVRRSLATNPLNEHHHGRIKDYSLHTFSDLLAPFQPHVALFRKIDLTLKSIHSGKYAMAQTEKDFAIAHKLLDRGRVAKEFVVNAERAGAVFRDQLGRPWREIRNLTQTEYALFAVLIPRIAATDASMSDAEYDKALKMTERLLEGFWKDAVRTYNAKTDSFSLDLSLAKQSVQRYAMTARVRRYFLSEPKGLPARHAYVSTVLYGLLQDARTLGVLAPATLRFLRVVDRRLWLIADNVGRIVATTECGGVFSHYLAEVKRGRCIERPVVDSAVAGLSDEIDKVKFSDEEAAAVVRQLDGDTPIPVDQAMAARPEQRVFLAVVAVKTGVFHATALDERGSVLLDKCVKVPGLSADEMKRFGISAERYADIQAVGVTPAVLRALVLDQCMGNHVVLWSETSLGLLPGLGRAAKTVTVISRVLGVDDAVVSKGPVSLAQQDGVYSDEKPFPEFPDRPSVQAEAVRELWVGWSLREVDSVGKRGDRSSGSGFVSE